MSRVFDADLDGSFGTLKFGGKEYSMTSPSVKMMEAYEDDQKKKNLKGFAPLYELLAKMGVPKEVTPNLPHSIIKGIADSLAEDVGGKKSETES